MMRMVRRIDGLMWTRFDGRFSTINKSTNPVSRAAYLIYHHPHPILFIVLLLLLQNYPIPLNQYSFKNEANGKADDVSFPR